MSKVFEQRFLKRIQMARKYLKKDENLNYKGVS